MVTFVVADSVSGVDGDEPSAVLHGGVECVRQQLSPLRCSAHCATAQLPEWVHAPGSGVLKWCPQLTALMLNSQNTILDEDRSAIFNANYSINNT